MFALFLTPSYAPFAIAFLVMIGIGLIEAIGLGLGHLDLHGHADLDVDSGLLDWLGIGGELPILVWLTSLLGCFTLIGIAIQQITTATTGAPLGWPVAAGGALAAGLMLNALVSRGLARVMPRFETSVISTDDLLRRRGIVLEGTARRGSPARAKVVDQHGQAHFVMIEPHEDGDAIAQGESALLVRRAGGLFFAIPDCHALLRSI
jgi:hypothetical protein